MGWEGGGPQTPKFQKFLTFFGKNVDDSEKVLGRKHSKR